MHSVSVSDDIAAWSLKSPLDQSCHFGRRPTTSGPPLETDIVSAGRHVSKVPQPDSSTRQVRTFRDLFLITELLGSKAESDDVGF
jgi:hypothetical protein